MALQSGALASVVLTFAKAHAIGLSVLTSMGNEATTKTADVLDYLVEDEATKVICLFLEEIGDPVAFAAVAAKADRAGKPIVALKVGSSPAGQQAAMAHTGSVAGDDAVVDAVLRQLNIIRVTSLEELPTTGAALGYNRLPAGLRMGVLTLSGGSCDIIADAASAQGLAIPAFADETGPAAIGAHLPLFASAQNPLDVTGFGTLANLSGRTGPAWAPSITRSTSRCRTPTWTSCCSAGWPCPRSGRRTRPWPACSRPGWSGWPGGWPRPPSRSSRPRPPARTSAPTAGTC